MIEIPPEIQHFLTGAVLHGITVFLRVGALVSVMPAFGEQTVPVRVKLGIVIAFTLIVSPAVMTDTQIGNFPTLARFVLSETVIGLALGLAIRLFVLALQTAGSMAAQATSLSQILGGAAVEPIPAMGYVLVVAGLAIAVISGLHVQAAKLLIYSYDVFPVGQFPTPRAISAWGVARISHAFSLAFLLAAPFVATSLIYNLTLGVINRAMPQLMVAFVGAPVITLGGMALLLIASPVMLAAWIDAVSGFFSAPLEWPE